MKVEDGDEPVNINWENLDVSTTESTLRTCGLIFIMSLVLIGAFILLFYTSALSKEGNLTCPPISGTIKDKTEEDVKAINPENTREMECFC
jgi:hypothetical protein